MLKQVTESNTRRHTKIGLAIVIGVAVTGCAQDDNAEAVTVTGSIAATLSTGSAVSSVFAAGNAHTCAVINGGVQCWCANGKGQLGNNSTTDSSQRVTVRDLSGAQAITAGALHPCAIVNGGARCWGYNLRGQLGTSDPSVTESHVPVAVSGLTGVQTISAGDSHTCAIVSGAAKCWGADSFGQLGNGVSGDTGSLPDSRVPAQVTNLTGGVQALATGGSHSCAIVNGSV